LRMFEPSAVVRLNRKNECREQLLRRHRHLRASTLLRRMGDK
jgi:hypothetical protein